MYLRRTDSYGTFSDDDIAGLRSEASQREVIHVQCNAYSDPLARICIPWLVQSYSRCGFLHNIHDSHLMEWGGNEILMMSIDRYAGHAIEPTFYRRT